MAGVACWVDGVVEGEVQKHLEQRLGDTVVSEGLHYCLERKYIGKTFPFLQGFVITGLA